MPEPSDLLTLIRSLRATRSFRDEAVGDGTIDAIVDAARWTGSARNRQPWRVVVVAAAAEREALAGLGAYAQHLAGAPVVLVIGVDVASGEDAEFDAGRFAQSLMFAAHAHGLGTCPATFFPDANALRATALAGLAAPWRARTAIGLGHPAPSPFPPGTRSAIPRGRLPLDVVLRRPSGDRPPATR